MIFDLDTLDTTCYRHPGGGNAFFHCRPAPRCHKGKKVAGYGLNLKIIFIRNRLNVGTEFQNIPRLTLEGLANGFQGGEADGLGLAGFQDGQVLRRDVHGSGQVVQPQLALGEHDIQVDDDGHAVKR